MKKIREMIAPEDVIGLSGLGLLFYGLFQVFPPAAFIATGAILLYVALRASR